MSSRKETPDLLEAIFSESSATPETEPVTAKPVAPSKPKPATKKAAPAPTKQTAAVKTAPAAPAPMPPRWEYMEVIFREFRGWRPRAVNGRERGDWKTAPIITEYLTTVGADGWELVSITDEHRNEKTAYFKRQS